MDSPNTLNYFIGKGIVSFKRDGEEEFRDMGNAPTFEFTPNVTSLDHFSSRSGVKTKDRSVITETSGTAHIVLDEWTAENLAIALLGSVDTNTAGQKVINIFDSTTVGGELKLTGTNTVGPKWEYHFKRVEFIPSAALGAITDEWGQIDLTGNVLAVGGSFGTATLLAEESDEESSETV